MKQLREIGHDWLMGIATIVIVPIAVIFNAVEWFINNGLDWVKENRYGITQFVLLGASLILIGFAAVGFFITGGIARADYWALMWLALLLQLVGSWIARVRMLGTLKRSVNNTEELLKTVEGFKTLADKQQDAITRLIRERDELQAFIASATSSGDDERIH